MDVAAGVQPLLPVSPRVPLLRQPGVTPKTMVGGMYFVDDLRTVDDIESLEVIFYIQLCDIIDDLNQVESSDHFTPHMKNGFIEELVRRDLGMTFMRTPLQFRIV